MKRIRRIRNLKTFVKNGKRYRVVFSSPDKQRTERARNMYDNKTTALYHDTKKDWWLIGVRK